MHKQYKNRAYNINQLQADIFYGGSEPERHRGFNISNGPDSDEDYFLILLLN